MITFLNSNLFFRPVHGTIKLGWENIMDFSKKP